jgi:hypothetical protein
MSLNELLTDGKKPWCDLKVNTVLSKKKISSVSANFELDSKNSGCVYVFPLLSGGVEVTLPLPADIGAGCYYEFYSQIDQSNSITFTCPQAKIGLIALDGMRSGGTLAGKSGEPASSFAMEGGKISLGDRVTLLSDGVNWYATAYCKLETAVSFS